MMPLQQDHCTEYLTVHIAPDVLRLWKEVGILHKST